MVKASDQEPANYIIIFDVWGHRCRTEFARIDPALDWLATCYDKGFLRPFEIRAHYDNAPDMIVYDDEQLLGMMP